MVSGNSVDAASGLESAQQRYAVRRFLDSRIALDARAGSLKIIPVKSRYCGQVSAVTFTPSALASLTSCSSSAVDKWQMCTRAPVFRASSIALRVAFTQASRGLTSGCLSTGIEPPHSSSSLSRAARIVASSSVRLSAPERRRKVLQVYCCRQQACCPSTIRETVLCRPSGCSRPSAAHRHCHLWRR